MARIDKYNPVAGGFRAPLNAAYTGAVAPLGVGLNSSGRVVAGPGQTGILGVIVSPYDKAAGDIIDVMTAGELTEFGGTAGTRYYAHASTGVISTTPSIYPVGTTVEAARLVVRCGDPAPATNVVGDQTTIAALTDSTTGTANATVTDVGGAFNQATLNNNFADLTAKINAIITALSASGLIA